MLLIIRLHNNYYNKINLENGLKRFEKCPNNAILKREKRPKTEFDIFFGASTALVFHTFIPEDPEHTRQERQESPSNVHRRHQANEYIEKTPKLFHCGPQESPSKKRPHIPRCLLLLGHSHGASTTTGRLGVLSSDTQTPVMTHTSVGADLLQTLQVLTQLRVQIGGSQLGVLAVDDVLLPVEEPVRDLVLEWVLDDRHQLLDLDR